MNLYVSNGTVSLPKLYLLKSSLEKKNKEKTNSCCHLMKNKRGCKRKPGTKTLEKTTALRRNILQAGLIQCDKTCFFFFFFQLTSIKGYFFRGFKHIDDSQSCKIHGTTFKHIAFSLYSEFRRCPNE